MITQLKYSTLYRRYSGESCITQYEFDKYPTHSTDKYPNSLIVSLGLQQSFIDQKYQYIDEVKVIFSEFYLARNICLTFLIDQLYFLEVVNKKHIRFGFFRVV